MFCQFLLPVSFLFTPGKREALCEESILPKGHNTMPDSARVRIWECSMPVSNDFKAVSGFPKLQEQVRHLSALSLHVKDQNWNNINKIIKFVRSLTKDVKYWGPTDFIGQVAWKEHRNDNTQSWSWKYSRDVCFGLSSETDLIIWSINKNNTKLFYQ